MSRPSGHSCCICICTGMSISVYQKGLEKTSSLGRTMLCGLTEVNMRKVAVIMGSDSDLPKVEKAITTLKEYGVPVQVHVFSAHRTPVQARDFALSARKEGYGAIIAAAGKAAHLAGALAANTTLPVIGIPVSASTLDGLDALLATVQMPSGIPVATVAIDGAQNAALLAIQMLAIEDASLAEKLDEARRESEYTVLRKNAAIEEKFNN